MDKIKCRNVGEAALAALQAVANEFGLVVTQRAGTYGDSNTTLKFEFAEIGEGGIVKTRAATDFEAYAPNYGLERADLGRKFHSNGIEYTITGCKPRATKMPILAARADGKTYKFRADAVARMLEAS